MTWFASYSKKSFEELASHVKFEKIFWYCTQGSRQNFAIGGALCIINNLGSLRCGQLHVRSCKLRFINKFCKLSFINKSKLQVAMQRSKAKQKLVKGQLTLFDERASAETDNLGKS